MYNTSIVLAAAFAGGCSLGGSLVFVIMQTIWKMHTAIRIRDLNRMIALLNKAIENTKGE